MKSHNDEICSQCLGAIGKLAEAVDHLTDSNDRVCINLEAVIRNFQTAVPLRIVLILIILVAAASQGAEVVKAVLAFSF